MSVWKRCSESARPDSADSTVCRGSQPVRPRLGERRRGGAVPAVEQRGHLTGGPCERVEDSEAAALRTSATDAWNSGVVNLIVMTPRCPRRGPPTGSKAICGLRRVGTRSPCADASPSPRSPSGCWPQCLAAPTTYADPPAPAQAQARGPGQGLDGGRQDRLRDRPQQAEPGLVHPAGRPGQRGVLPRPLHAERAHPRADRARRRRTPTARAGDMTTVVTRPDERSLRFTQVSTDKDGHYRLTEEVVTDPTPQRGRHPRERRVPRRRQAHARRPLRARAGQRRRAATTSAARRGRSRRSTTRPGWPARW